MKKLWPFILLVFVCFNSCKKEKPATCNQTQVSVLNTDLDKANVRIKNETNKTICQLQLKMNGNIILYGALNNLQYSKYKAFDEIYKYAPITAFVPGDSLQIAPIDFTGEIPLVAGLYTYIISNPNGKTLSIVLQKD